MPGKDIIVIETSAGGIDTLKVIAGELRADLLRQVVMRRLEAEPGEDRADRQRGISFARYISGARVEHVN
jgi:hypothetical protein